MSNRNEQNGRQPPLPGQPPPSLDGDPSHENAAVVEKKEICRNFVWGSCNKGVQCKFRHELDFEEMKKILKFCHDFQNPPGCTRDHCTYIHATKDEESLFYSTGALPRVLAERHENMSALAAETIPQIALFIRESCPPPPPPPPLPVPVGAPMPLVAAHAVRPAPPMLPMQQLPPPPPPPTVASTTMHQHAPIFTAPTAQPSTSFPINQAPPPMVPIFDASRPPPPLPHGQSSSGALKRLSQGQYEAQPKKMRKLEKENSPDAYCEQCIQRQNRIKYLKQEMEKLCSEEEYQTLIHRKKLEDYQNLKEILRSLLGNDVFRLVEASIEETPQQLEVSDIFTRLNQTSFLTETSNVSKNVLLKFVKWFMDDSRIGPVSSPALRLDDSLLQSISTQPRRSTNIGLSPSTDFYEQIMELLKKSTEEPQGSRGPPALQAAPPPPIYHPYTPAGPPPAPPPRLYYPPPFPVPSTAAGDPQGSRGPPALQAAPQPPIYHPYPIAGPSHAPPQIIYYPASIPGPSTVSVSANQMIRAPPPPAPPPPAPHPTQTCHPYSSARYPPPFYQRHQ